MNIFDMLDAASGKKAIIKAPFARSGAKSRIVGFVTDNIPHSKTFVDVFGGTGVVMLNKLPTDNDVFNDINSGICSVYRCLRDKDKMERLIDWIDNTIQSYEEWLFCKDTWKDVNDDVERAGRWLYMINYSFSSQGRAYGYAKNSRGLAGILVKRIECFSAVHSRFRNVNVENATWQEMLRKYDSKETVFYLDPPYPDSDMQACYGKDKMEWIEHRQMMEIIPSLRGKVVLSGYANKLYDSQDFWTKRVTESTYVSVGKKEDRHTAEEVLWIKN